MESNWPGKPGPASKIIFERRRMMIRTVVQFVSICVMSLFAASVFGADLGGFKNYSADMETITPQGSQISKIFSKDGKTRMESGMRGSGIISIIRPDKKVVWMVMVDGKAYMEMPFDKSKNDIQSKLHDPNAKVD